MVDADANSNLNEVLGVEVETTLGDIREEMARAEQLTVSPMPVGYDQGRSTRRCKFSAALIGGRRL